MKYFIFNLNIMAITVTAKMLSFHMHIKRSYFTMLRKKVKLY